MILAGAVARRAGVVRREDGTVPVRVVIGLPLIAASGAGFSLPAAVLYPCLATSPLTWTSTVAVASAYGRPAEGPRMEARDVVRSLLVPPTVALVAGLAANLAGVSLPEAAERPSRSSPRRHCR